MKRIIQILGLFIILIFPIAIISTIIIFIVGNLGWEFKLIGIALCILLFNLFYKDGIDRIIEYLQGGNNEK